MAAVKFEVTSESGIPMGTVDESAPIISGRVVLVKMPAKAKTLRDLAVGDEAVISTKLDTAGANVRQPATLDRRTAKFRVKRVK